MVWGQSVDVQDAEGIRGHKCASDHIRCPRCHHTLSAPVAYLPSFYLQARELKSWGADGVIVGSALVRALGESSSKVTHKSLRTLCTHRACLL
jgi:hypothetical protein